MVPISLVPVLALSHFYVSPFRSMCAVANMAVFRSSLTSWFPGMLLMYILNDFEMVPVVPIITGITLVFTFHMRCISIVRSLYFKIFWASFLITLLLLLLLLQIPRAFLCNTYLYLKGQITKKQENEIFFDFTMKNKYPFYLCTLNFEIARGIILTIVFKTQNFIFVIFFTFYVIHPSRTPPCRWSQVAETCRKLRYYNTIN